MSPTNDTLTPRPEHRFTFGLWTVGNPGRDPFGGPTREPVDPVDSVKRLGELGAWGVSLHDEDLIPWGTPAAERDRLVARFKAALDEAGMGVGMGDDQPVRPSGVQGRRVHVQRPRACAARRSARRCAASTSRPS